MTRYAKQRNGFDDNTLEGEISDGTSPEEGDPELMDVIAQVARKLLEEKKKHQQTLADAVHKSLQKRVAKAKYGDPASAKLAVRRQGLLARPHPRDQARFDASIANNQRAILLAQLIKQQGDFIANGKHYLLQVLQDAHAMDDDVPDDLLPIAQGLTQFIDEVFPGTFAEAISMIGEVGLKEIANATKPREES
jgi:hypothetical protein